MQVRQLDIADVLKRLPAASPLEESLDKPVDWVICPVGFEDRTFHALQTIAASKEPRSISLLFLTYPTNIQDNVRHDKEFRAAAASMRDVAALEYRRTEFAAQLEGALGRVADDSCVTVDISTCSSYLFYPLMRQLLSRDLRIRIAYTEAQSYYPSRQEWDVVAERAKDEGLFVTAFENADFQSSGIDDVYPYAPFAEMNAGNRPSCLVAIPNFNAARMSAIVTRDREINKTPFKGIIWIVGAPPSSENAWRAEAVSRTNLLENVADKNLRAISTFDYKNALETLEDIWLERRYGFQMSIAPLGSKMQHLGTFLFLALHQEVGLWLAEPRQYRAARFSQGVGQAWVVDLGSTKDLRNDLASYMSFRWTF